MPIEQLLYPLLLKIVFGLLVLLVGFVGVFWRRMEKQHDLLAARVNELHVCLDRRAQDAYDWRIRMEQRLGKIDVHIEYIREKLQNL